MPRKNDGEGTRDRKKKGGPKSEGFSHYVSQKHVRCKEILIRGSNGHSKNEKEKN